MASEVLAKLFTPIVALSSEAARSGHTWTHEHHRTLVQTIEKLLQEIASEVLAEFVVGSANIYSAWDGDDYIVLMNNPARECPQAAVPAQRLRSTSGAERKFLGGKVRVLFEPKEK